MTRRTFLRHGALAAAGALAAGAGPAFAQAGVTRIVVPYAPGGAADITGRVYADKLRAAGLPDVIVDNRPGASGRLGLDVVRKSKADGLTLLLVPSPLLTIYPWTYRNLGYDPDADLAPVAMLVEIPTAIAAGVDQPYADMPQFVEWMKKNPARANLGVASVGSSGHLGAAALGKAVGVEIQVVSYKGAAPMLVDVASGQVAIGWDAAASMTQLYRAKKIRLLGVSGTRRVASLPEVPTIREQGFAQFESATSFYAICAPAGTPPERIAVLEKAFLAASADAELTSKLESAGLVPMPLPAAPLAERARRERAFWGPIVKSVGVSLE